MAGTLTPFKAPAQAGSVEGGVDAADVSSLYLALSRGDESAARLARARFHLLRRFERIRARSLEIAREWASTEKYPVWSSIDSDGEPLDPGASGAPLFNHWLREELIVLRRISDAAISDHPVYVMLFAVYNRWRADPALDAFGSAAASVAAVASRHGGGGTASPGSTVSLYAEAALIRHALSSFPGSRLPEIIGYLTAAMQSFQLHPFTLGDAAQRLVRDEELVKRVLRLFLSTFENDSARMEAMRERVALGIALHESLLVQIRWAQRIQLRHSEDSNAAFVQALRQKAWFAAGHHSNVTLAGRSLDDWFGDQPFDGEAFLDALAGSPWVDRDHPGESRILKLLDFDGPMFGVFTDAERRALGLWLDSVGRDGKQTGAACGCEHLDADSSGDTAHRFDRRNSDRGKRFDVADGRSWMTATEVPATAVAPTFQSANRGLFHGLLDLETHPDWLATARRHAETCLAAASRPLFPRRPSFRYSHQAFDDWLDAQYRKQMRRPAKARSRPALSRQAYLFGIEQLAPAILVDGCWLQRTEHLRYESPEVARRLMAIYADELGNGVLEHNHPHVYRRLLESLRIDLPPTASAAFAHHPGFLDSAFDLPVFMLSISLSPHRFLPELLGLNLAIELSGLGASYTRLARDLDYWGIDSKIVRLHQSIDNLASGHAALAREGIMIHLDQVRALGGEPAVQQHWPRIWTGYRSLGTVTRRFRWQLVASYGVRTGLRWIRDFFA